MKPRQPYRSPFWRPEFADEPQAATRREMKAAPAARPAEPRTPPPHRAQHPSTPERLVPYAPSDLALFGKLMSFGPGREAAATPHSAPTRHEPAVRPRRADVAAGKRSNPYTGRDAALFQGLEASFAGVAQPAAASAAAPPAPTRGYTQADLDAFDTLAKFGRSA